MILFFMRFEYVLNEWMNEWMNEKFIHAFISKNRPKSAETEQNDKFSKKIIIGDDPIQYPNGAVTMDEDCDRD